MKKLELLPVELLWREVDHQQDTVEDTGLNQQHKELLLLLKKKKDHGTQLNQERYSSNLLLLPLKQSLLRILSKLKELLLPNF
jgi:hypothetical protein